MGHELEASEVHVWAADLNSDQALQDRLANLLTKQELTRADRFKFAKHRRRYIAAHGYLRQLLGRYLDMPAERVRLGSRPRGKPVLAPESASVDMHFNMAHSGDRAAYAFAIGSDVGVDIETAKATDDLPDLAVRFFAPAETEALSALSGPDWVEGFFNCWTRKEAVLKLWGDGLYLPLDQFVVSLRPGDPARLVSAAPGLNRATDLDLTSFDAGPKHIGAVAFPKGRRVVERGIFRTAG